METASLWLLIVLVIQRSYEATAFIAPTLVGSALDRSSGLRQIRGMSQPVKTLRPYGNNQRKSHCHQMQLAVSFRQTTSSITSFIASNPNISTIAPVVASVLILATYHIKLLLYERDANTPKTWRSFQADTREDWAIFVRNTEGWLYAVQTLRNAITAQTFLATTVLSLLTLITGRIWDILRATTSTFEKNIRTIQLISIASTMLLSAYNFLQGVRFMTHAGFMFPVSKGTKVDKIMRQTQNSQWLGLRWMYLSLGPIAWAVGGGWTFLVMSLLLLQFFRMIDKKPEGMGYEEFQGGGI